MKKLIIVLITLVISTCFISPVMASEKASDFLKSKVITDQGEGNTVWISPQYYGQTQYFSTESECQKYIDDYKITGNCTSQDYYTLEDGLYEDPTEPGRYVFKGEDPNNYIKLGDDLYRIISVEKDGTLKVMSSTTADANRFDSGTDRTSGKENDYCTEIGNISYSWGSNGCNVWGSNTTTLDRNGNNVTTIYVKTNEKEYNLPSREASLNTYLNGEWYEGLDKNVQNLIVNHDFNIGLISKDDESLLELVSEESEYKWNGKIALINVTDYIKANNNSACNNITMYQWNMSYICGGSHDFNENYLSTYSGYFLLTPQINYDVLIAGSGLSFAEGYDASVYPTFYLKSNITLSGSGTLSDAFTASLYKSESSGSQTSDSEESENNPTQVVEVPSTSAYASLIIGVIGIICIIVAIVVMYFTSKKKKVKD